MGVGMFGLQAPPSLCSQARTQWLNHGFAKGCFTLVGRVFEHAANGGTVPNGLASSCSFLDRFQTATNLSTGASISSDPFEDLADHAGLFPHNLKAGLSSSFLFRHIAIPVRGSSQHAYLSDLRSMPLASPTPLQDFC